MVPYASYAESMRLQDVVYLICAGTIHSVCGQLARWWCKICYDRCLLCTGTLPHNTMEALRGH